MFELIKLAHNGTETLNRKIYLKILPILPPKSSGLVANVRRELWNPLWDHGAYASEGRGVVISDELYAVVKNNLPWPEQKEKKVSKMQVGTTAAVVEEYQEMER